MRLAVCGRPVPEGRLIKVIARSDVHTHTHVYLYTYILYCIKQHIILCPRFAQGSNFPSNQFAPYAGKEKNRSKPMSPVRGEVVFYSTEGSPKSDQIRPRVSCVSLLPRCYFGLTLLIVIFDYAVRCCPSLKIILQTIYGLAQVSHRFPSIRNNLMQ